MHHNKKITGFISDILKARSEVSELVVLAIILAFGVNLASSYLSNVFSTNDTGLYGTLVLTIGIAYVLYRRFFNGPQILKNKAIISIGPTKNQLVKINEYDFSYSFGMILDSLFKENKAIRSQWENGVFSPYNDKGRLSVEEFEKSESQKLVKEITEYIYLDYLSIHLADYFNGDGYDKQFIQELFRNDLPDIVLSNRVLDMISKDRKDRPAFAKERKSKGEDEKDGEVVMSWVNGVLYSKFSLVLPKGSTISREANSSITIKNRNMKLNFQIVSEGSNTFVDHVFTKYYMKLDKLKSSFETNHYAVNIITEITIRPTFALFSKKVKYQQWADSFLESVDHQLSFETFLNDINWKTVKTMLRTDYILKPIDKHINTPDVIEKEEQSR